MTPIPATALIDLTTKLTDNKAIFDNSLNCYRKKCCTRGHAATFFSEKLIFLFFTLIFDSSLVMIFLVNSDSKLCKLQIFYNIIYI